MDKDTVNLSVVIPAYNEENTIEATLYNINEYFEKQNIIFEIVVVDDGSCDETSSKVKSIAKKLNSVKLVSYKENKGKGEAISQGVLVAKGEFILFSDADLSTPISEIEKFMPYLANGYDIVIGSRRVMDSQITRKQPFPRRLSGKVLQMLVRTVLHLPFFDTQCGFKLFRGSIAKKLFAELKHKGFVFDVEIIYRAVKSGYRIKEIGVIWANDPTTTVRFLRDSFKCFVELIQIRFQN